MSYQFIDVTTQQGVATITLNRAEKRNAMHGDFIRELLHALKHLNAATDTRVLMIKGAGDHFCAGADIAWMQKISSASYNDNYDDAQLIADLMYQLHTFIHPTIVLAQGATMGGGLGLLAACDIAIAAKNASFRFSEVKMGITPSTISPYVIAAMGARAARYYFLTGEQFSADDAYRLGLIHHVTDNESLFTLGNTIAQTLLQNSPHALKAAKQLVREVSDEKITEQLAQKTAEHLANVRSMRDAAEGLRAFIEKRAPDWRSI